jgi:hypothetical protein
MPLPRANENIMYSIYEEINDRFSWNQYSLAFKFTSKKVDDYHRGLRMERSKILYNVFNRKAETKVIVGIGDRHTKRKFFEEYYEIVSPFNGIDLGKNKVEVFEGDIMIKNEVIPVFLSNFLFVLPKRLITG